jgi:phospholipid/cholesterol/gamma-HCH transport system ATP-binding protein
MSNAGFFPNLNRPPEIPVRTQGQAVAEQTLSADAIVFENVELAFEEKPVLSGISFQLARGETKAIFGVAGSGKSTILKLALGLLKPDSGRILVLGEDVTEMTEDQLFELRRRVGIVFQESALFDSLTVRENVAYRLLEEGKLSEDEIEKRVREALSFVELEHTVDLYPNELSGGMRRRVAIARTIITNPEVVLYDSPTGGLDPVTSNTIIEMIVKQRDVYKTSSLLVTHRLQDAFTMGTHYFDRKENKMKPLPPHTRAEVPMGFLVLRDGKIIFDGDLKGLRETQDPYIREYIS